MRQRVRAFHIGYQTVATLVAFGLVIGLAVGDEQTPAGGQHPKEFEKEVTFKAKMRYQLFLPEGYGDADRAWPLIMFLHGRFETGSDLEKVKRHGPPKIVETKKDFPFIVLSPQSPRRGWTRRLHMLIALLDEVVSKYNVDQDRIYLTGLSMGGSGTWALAAAYPDRFAAIVPICGGGYPEDAERLKDLPTWVFHGAKDRPVPISYSRTMVDALKAVGGNVKFTVYPDTGHDAWTETYDNPELYRWLLEHRRPAGAWGGTWQGQKGPGGELRCVAWRVDQENWKARFTGYCGRQFAFEVEMEGRQEGEAVRFEGEADLGEKDGGLYHWSGQIVGNTFTGKYLSSLGKKGEFRMSREKTRQGASDP